MNAHSLAKTFKALSNEQRLKIFQTLCQWDKAGGRNPKSKIASELLDRCFTRTCCTVELSRSTISHHYKELKAAGLISVKRTGQSFQCTIHYDVVNELREFLSAPDAK